MDRLGASILALLAVLVAGLIFLKNGPSSAGRPAPRMTLAIPASPIETAASSNVRIIDGDTIVVDGEHMRLFGIDAPEKGQICTMNGQPQRCGPMATEALRRFIGNGPVTCERRSNDRYGRTVAVCSAAGRDLGREMVHSGWAIAFVRYSNEYVEDENRARVSRRGLWEGQFERPEQWRAERRAR